MKTIATTMKLMLIFAVIGLVSLHLLSIQGNSFSGSNNSDHLAFAVTNGQPISQKLTYAHFLPLTNNSKLHQVKIIVDYVPIGAAQNAIMKVYASNGTPVKVSLFPHGLKTTTAGKAQFATSISDSTIKQVNAHIMFTDSLRNANFSNPINVKLNLGQIVQPTS